MTNINDYIFKRLKRNVDFTWLAFLLEDDFYIAGNSLNSSNPNDIDIFPASKNQFDGVYRKVNKASELDKILSDTKNAITVKHNGTIYQFCNYYHESLEKLVLSFDFSHIQIGIKIKLDRDFTENVKYELFMSDEYKNSKIIGDTQYSKSEYPLSSLIRTFKYFKRGDFSGKSYIVSVISIITDIVERGFKDYEDFKDQLDAVDLGLLPDDLELFKPWDNTLKHLYNSLTKGKKISEDK